MLIFEEKIPSAYRSAFVKKLKDIASKYKLNPNWLMALINSETGGTFRADTYNKAGSGAVGLIQFMPSTARQLGTSTSALAKLSAVEQLDWVDKYLAYTANYLGAKIGDIDYDDLYLMVFYPAAVGKPNDFVIARSPSATYVQNKGIDDNQDGLLTVSDFKKFIRKKIPSTQLYMFTRRYRYAYVVYALLGLAAIVGGFYYYFKFKK